MFRKKLLSTFSFIILSVFVMQAQNIDLQKKITVIKKKQTLSSVLNEIHKKANINFSYNTENINGNIKVTLIARNKSVKDVLSLLFSDLNIEYVIVEKQIILKKRYYIPPPVIKKNKNPEKYIISGYIKDSLTNEVLIGAGISVKSSYLGAMTNAYGFYSLSLPAGKYILVFSSLGYKNKTLAVNLTSDKQISELLKYEETELDIVVINEDEKKDVFEKNPLKKIDLNQRMINSAKGVTGEADVVKSINNLPGINSFGDGSVLFYVRGGDKDQNLILIDEAPIYNPSHLFGFFSALAPDAIKDIKVYKNNFPVKYGGRLSSLIDIKTKDGNMNKLGFSVVLNPLTGSYTLDGPIKKKRSSFLMTLRDSHLNWIWKRNLPDLNVNFYDFHLKFNQIINSKNRIYFSMFTGSDILLYGKNAGIASGLSWKNNVLSFRWNHLFSDKMFSNTTLHASKYDYYLYYERDNNKYWTSYIGDISLKTDFSYYTKPGNKIFFGYNINNYIFNPGNLDADYFSRSVYAGDVSEIVLYGGNDISLNEKVNLSYGIRYILWNNIGPTVSFSFDKNYQMTDTIYYDKGIYNTYNGFEPQISLTYSFSKSLLTTISFDRRVQFLHLLSNSVSPFTTMDVWMPSGPNIKPEKSNQYVLGLTKKMKEFDVSLQTYYKTISDYIEYNEHANMLLNPLIEGEVRFAEAKAYGAEFSFEKKKGNFNFLLSYTYSRILITGNKTSYTGIYPAAYDKPHKLNINLFYKTPKRWTFNLNWVYSSGLRFSSPTGFYNFNGYTVPIYSDKNNDCLPAYHRLDISADLRLNKNKNARFRHDLLFAIYNLYNRHNAIAINFDKIETDNGSFVVPSNFIYENELVVTSKSLSGLIPSITYSLKFR
ncbi:MAG: TonB-dependent receptor [Chlorobi bacterium]|nr:TonB-dependent receptor [Chlorobiota bacterium]